MKIIFEAFDCKKDNSILCNEVEIKRHRNRKGEKAWQSNRVIMGEVLEKAIREGADFCSVRFIKK